MLAFVLLATTDAQATLRVSNHNDPAGDPTVTNYQVTREDPERPWTSGVFPLLDNDYKSFGQGPGVYILQAAPAAGWEVGHIECLGDTPNDFEIDQQNGRVRVTHGLNDEQTCSFTNRKHVAGGSSPGGGGISPAPLPRELPRVVLPRHPALVGVKVGRGYAEATIRTTRRSILKGKLQRRNRRTVGSERIVRKAGTHVIRVNLQRKRMRRMQRRGLDHVTLTLRVAVTAKRSGATHVFKHRVRVKL